MSSISSFFKLAMAGSLATFAGGFSRKPPARKASSSLTLLYANPSAYYSICARITFIFRPSRFAGILIREAIRKNKQKSGTSPSIVGYRVEIEEQITFESVDLPRSGQRRERKTYIDYNLRFRTSVRTKSHGSKVTVRFVEVVDGQERSLPDQLNLLRAAH